MTDPTSKDRHTQTSELISVRSTLIELVLVAILIGVGVELTSAALQAIANGSIIALLFAGVTATLSGLLIISLRTGPKRAREYHFRAELPFAEGTHDITPPLRYEFAEKAHSFVAALTSENKALARLWNDHDFSEGEQRSRPNPPRGEADAAGPPYAYITRSQATPSEFQSPAKELLVELCEYFVISELSTHLSDYFNSAAIKHGSTKEFGRREIPASLLDNRFLDLFSRPMDQREAFSELPRHSAEGEITSASALGAIYEHLDLVLPTGSTITRHGRGHLGIRSRRMSVDIEIFYDGFAAAPPAHFVGLYMRRGYIETEFRLIELKIQVKFAWWSVFTPAGWEYFRWTDSFVETMAERFDFPTYMKRIGWETAASAAIAVLGPPKRRRRPASGAALSDSTLQEPEQSGLA